MSFEKESNNQRGGKRSGAGRKKGEPNKRTAEAAEKAAETGITPLEYLLNAMRTDDDPKIRMGAAVAAAPYVHAKLSSIDANVKHSGSAFDALLAAVSGTTIPIVTDD